MQHVPRARRGGRYVVALARVISAILIAGLLTAGTACGHDATIELADAYPSREALAQAVVDAFAAGDRSRLEALAVTEHEFRAAVWPRLPASRPDVGMTADYVWTDSHFKSRSDLLHTSAERRGRPSKVVAVSFKRAATGYGAFRVYPETHLTLRDEKGHTETARLFGSMIESGGRWKVYSYIVD